MLISVLADFIIVFFGILIFLCIIAAMILQSKNKEPIFTDDRIEQKVNDIRDTVCMLSDLILEETPEGQRFLEKHPEYFENDETNEGSVNDSKKN